MRHTRLLHIMIYQEGNEYRQFTLPPSLCLALFFQDILLLASLSCLNCSSSPPKATIGISLKYENKQGAQDKFVDSVVTRTRFESYGVAYLLTINRYLSVSTLLFSDL